MGRTVILDNGHGGIINGVYQTAGKRSPNWDQGILYEGMFNRWVVNRIIEKLDRIKIPYYHISPEYTDVTLETRTNRADRIYEANRNVWILSVHANAGGGTGIEGFTTIGETASDPICDIILRNFETALPHIVKRYDRADGDRDKEKDFHILKKPKAPAVLIECGFMDHRTDYAMLWNEEYVKTLVDSLVRSIGELYNQ
ncbi:MAG: N-acetylmuramoyl-L-alanine amidase [Saprospiraceae bacterium]|nr:N-acetylmuramoyl-L-alanine amidase [Saprospiraceae bacterium]